MIDPVILETARRNLAGSADLPDEDFWRAYGKIEDAALLCTEPQDHPAVMAALESSLRELGKTRSLVEIVAEAAAAGRFDEAREPED